MPGSRRPFQYTADGGQLFWMDLDESTYERLEYGFGQTVDGNILTDYKSRLSPSRKFPLEPRYIRCVRQDADGRTVKRKVYVGSTTALVWTAGVVTATLDDGTYTIVQKVGEKGHLPSNIDTGLIDGDVETITTPPPGP